MDQSNVPASTEGHLRKDSNDKGDRATGRMQDIEAEERSLDELKEQLQLHILYIDEAWGGVSDREEKLDHLRGHLSQARRDLAVEQNIYAKLKAEYNTKEEELLEMYDDPLEEIVRANAIRKRAYKFANIKHILRSVQGDKEATLKKNLAGLQKELTTLEEDEYAKKAAVRDAERQLDLCVCGQGVAGENVREAKRKIFSIGQRMLRERKKIAKLGEECAAMEKERAATEKEVAAKEEELRAIKEACTPETEGGL